MGRYLASVLFVALGLVGPRASTAQEPAADGVVARDSGAVMQRLGDGAYVIIHDDATEEWPHGNSGVIVGRNGVLVIDSNYLPSRAVADIALIRRVTNLPVRYLLNTHWHGDHTHGNSAYRDAFPDLVILGSREAAKFIALNQQKLPTGALAPDSYTRQGIARVEAALRKGSDSTGRRWTDEERKALAANLGQRQIELAELAKVRVAAPNLIFERSIRLDLGDRMVEIRSMGPANSAEDVIAYLARERILFTGDILVYPTPYTAGSFFMPWIEVLARVKEYSVTALVPGHGPVLRDHQYTGAVQQLFDTVRRQLDSLYLLGLSPPEAAKRVDVKALRENFHFVPGGRLVRAEYWDEYTRMVAEKMSLCVMGYSC